MPSAHREPQDRAVAFNYAQWANDHEERDKERFKAMNDSIVGIRKILAVAGMSLIAVTGWSLKTQYDQVQKQNDTLRAIYAVSGQVANVQATAVPKP